MLAMLTAIDRIDPTRAPMIGLRQSIRSFGPSPAQSFLKHIVIRVLTIHRKRAG